MNRYKNIKSIGATILRILDYPRFFLCMWIGRPYFGRIMGATQGSFFRYPLMATFLKERIKPGFKILEIGSWAGGSALVFGRVCEEKNMGTVLCIDSWKNEGTYSPVMEKAQKRNRIFKLFSHNVFYSGANNRINIIRADTNYILPLLAPQSFDMIYIDGSHSYSQVKKDIQNSLILLKAGGVMCGDDLELQYEKIDADYATKNKEKDYIKDPTTNTFFHPGVCLAVHEMIGKVEEKQGFWWHAM